MDPISETLVGLDALAKLVVCTIGLFCVPILTRKYAQNLGLPAGQTIMSKAFLATQLSGLPAIASAAKGAAKSGLLSSASRTKEITSSIGKHSLIGAEKFGRSLTSQLSGNSTSAAHSRLENFFDEQSQKKGLMKEAGVSPWTRKDENRLQRAKNPAELKALASQKQASIQFEKDWQKLTRENPKNSLQAGVQAKDGSMIRQKASNSPKASRFESNRTPTRAQGFDSPNTLRSEVRPRSDSNSSAKEIISRTGLAHDTSRQSIIHNLSQSKNSNGARSEKVKTSDLYHRYQQIINRRKNWKEPRK